MHGLFGSEGDISGRSGRVRFICREATTSRLGGDFGLARSPQGQPWASTNSAARTAVSHSTLLSRLKNSMFEYQTTESHAPLGPMSGANSF
jgi:hypothetical protein